MRKDLRPAFREWRQVLMRDPCAYCGGSSNTVDHVEPLVLGGTDHHENLAGACVECNLRKGHRGVLQTLLRMPYRNDLDVSAMSPGIRRFELERRAREAKAIRADKVQTRRVLQRRGVFPLTERFEELLAIRAGRP